MASFEAPLLASTEIKQLNVLISEASTHDDMTALPLLISSFITVPALGSFKACSSPQVFLSRIGVCCGMQYNIVCSTWNILLRYYFTDL